MAVFKKHLRKHIFVHPSQQDKLNVAVKSTLLRDKRKFSDRLQGALMDVSNPKVVGDRYLVVDGFLSMEVEADFQVFSPTVGMHLQGTVNKISKGHIGCLVMDIFNASIAKQPGSTVLLDIGNPCEFKVTDVIINGEILSLRGTLSSTYTETYDEYKVEENNKKDSEKKKVSWGEEKTEVPPTESSTNIFIKKEDTSDYDLFGRGVLTQTDPTPKKSPEKHKRIKEEPVSEESFVEDGSKSPRKRSKSSHKNKDKHVSLNESNNDSLLINEETSTPSKKAKKKKKKKISP